MEWVKVEERDLLLFIPLLMDSPGIDELEQKLQVLASQTSIEWAYF